VTGSDAGLGRRYLVTPTCQAGDRIGSGYDATEGKEVTVNTIMSFSEILYIWLGLTVVAAIAGSIAR
jgi:hypothetical protein